jgi:hypothetical protein
MRLLDKARKDIDNIIENSPSKQTWFDRVKDYPKDLEIAALNLTILKENFEYLTFFEKFKEMNSESFILEVRLDSDESFDDCLERIWSLAKKGLPFLKDLLSPFGINASILEVLLALGMPFSEVLSLFDPKKDLTDVSSQHLLEHLPNLFYSPGMFQIVFEKDTAEHFNIIEYKSPQTILPKLRPYERLIKVDLRKKKKDLEMEFKEFLEYAYKHKEHADSIKRDEPHTNSPFLDRYRTWEMDKGRYRDEAWTQLEVWHLRKQRKLFAEIAKELTLTEDTAKKSFYRAYELTQGKPYDPEMLRKEIWIVRKSELQKICENCPDRDTCTILCPEALAYVDQDIVNSSREKLLDEDTDSLKDFLTHKCTT